MSESILIKTNRKKTRPIFMGNLKIGNDAPIRVQSMLKTDTKDEKSCIDQIRALEAAGCEIVRISIPDEESCEKLKIYKKVSKIPIVADIHFNYKLAVKAIINGADGIRINPGNIGSKSNVKEIVETARKLNKVIRIGVNAGSIEKRVRKEGLKGYKALINSALYWIKIFEDWDFLNFKVSVKSSSVIDTINAYRELSELTSAPLHIGITEAGFDRHAIVKSAIGIGSLIIDGIGDTIRVSLTGDPVREVEVGYEILSSCGVRDWGVEIISCPTCARVKIDVESLAKEVKERLKSIKSPLKIAVMGCEVNGPGEAKEADLGVAGAKGFALIFKKGTVIKKVKTKKEILDTLHKLAKQLAGGI